MKLITFTVPCYNSAAYMDHCIETLLTAGEDAEIILVDDGSKDDTGKIADAYAEKYPTTVCTHTQPSMGMRNWKKANTPAMPDMRPRRMRGSFRPLARDTEKASIARPTPSSALLAKKRRFHCMFFILRLHNEQKPRHGWPYLSNPL